jgi:hypothetical protein
MVDNPIISVSIPQTPDDLDLYEEIRLVLMARGFLELDTSIEYETNSIRYRFQRRTDREDE